jgi:glycosyltransferase involved in cell wall biosynthesis
MGSAITNFDPDVIILSDHGAPGLGLKKGRAKIVLVSHHNPARFVGRYFEQFSTLDVKWAIGLEQKVLKRTDVVVCPSRYMSDWFEKTYDFSGPIKVIPNLLDKRLLDSIEPYDLRSQLGLDPAEIIVYMPSAGSRLKGSGHLFTILKGLLSITQQSFGVYIPGALPPEITAQINSIDPRIRLCFAGQMPYGEHIANMKSCSFGISPSLIENYSMAILEAVHCGVPMIAFETGGNADIIRNEENGHLFAETDDLENLIQFASSLFDKANLADLKERAAMYSAENLSSQTAFEQYLDLIKE